MRSGPPGPRCAWLGLLERSCVEAVRRSPASLAMDAMQKNWLLRSGAQLLQASPAS